MASAVADLAAWLRAVYARRREGGQAVVLPVNLAAVADGEYADLASTIVDFVENAIITDADAPLVATARKFFGIVGPGLCAELIDGGLDAGGAI